MQTKQNLFVPYRVCPLGAHIDHQKGIVTGFALEKGVTLEYAPLTCSAVRLTSKNFEGEASFSLSSPLVKSGSWIDYAQAAAWVLIQNGYKLKNGFCGKISGELSAGGLSSSAAVIISYIKALCFTNDIHLSEQELILTAQKAENGFIGLNCGTLDQSCEILCRKNRLLTLDTSNGKFKNIPCPDNMPEFEIAVFFSGLTRSLVSSNYNLRTEELKAACKTLKNLGKINTENDVLRDIPFEIYDKFKDALPLNQQKRCEHYYSEMMRVEKGIEAFEKGDISAFGQYVFESGQSSVDNYEAGSPELIKLYNIIKNTEGIYGGRFSGAGFKGCCMAITDPKKRDEIAESVTSEYCKAFPSLADKFSVHFCKTADGCGNN